MPRDNDLINRPKAGAGLPWMLEFASGMPMSGPIKTIRRGLKWRQRVARSDVVLCQVVHNTIVGPAQRKMVVRSCTVMSAKDIGAREFDKLKASVYPTLEPDEDVTVIELEDAKRG